MGKNLRTKGKKHDFGNHVDLYGLFMIIDVGLLMMIDDYWNDVGLIYDY